jgi:hypothetical protein
MSATSKSQSDLSPLRITVRSPKRHVRIFTTTGATPDQMKTEMITHPDQEYKYRSKPTWSKTVDGLQIQFWRERWYDTGDYVRHRDQHFKISADNRLVADGTFQEWDSTPNDRISLNHFACVADGHSSDTYEMGEALFSSFCRYESKYGESPLDHGSILMLDRVRIQAASAKESKAVWSQINGIVRRLARNARSPVAGLILKAFPLDNMGMNTLPMDEENRAAFDRRQLAMMRLYEQRLGVETLPGASGEDGWQWLGINFEAPPLLSKRRPNFF